MKYLTYSLILIIGLAACTSSGKKQIDPDKTSAINVELGTEYMKQGNLDLAKFKFEKALDQNPDLASAHSGYALLMNQLGQTAKAQKHFKKALKLDPDESGTLNNYG